MKALLRTVVAEVVAAGYSESLEGILPLPHAHLIRVPPVSVAAHVSRHGLGVRVFKVDHSFKGRSDRRKGAAALSEKLIARQRSRISEMAEKINKGSLVEEKRLLECRQCRCGVGELHEHFLDFLNGDSEFRGIRLVEAVRLSDLGPKGSFVSREDIVDEPVVPLPKQG